MTTRWLSSRSMAWTLLPSFSRFVRCVLTSHDYRTICTGLTCLFLKLLIPLQLFWALSLGLSKASILLLYSSVFAVRPVIWTARCAIVFIALWVIGTIMAGLLICRPFAMNWDHTIPGGKCGD